MTQFQYSLWWLISDYIWCMKSKPVPWNLYQTAVPHNSDCGFYTALNKRYTDELMELHVAKNQKFDQ